jgi:hypothetical protein
MFGIRDISLYKLKVFGTKWKQIAFTEVKKAKELCPLFAPGTLSLCHS